MISPIVFITNCNVIFITYMENLLKENSFKLMKPIKINVLVLKPFYIGVCWFGVVFQKILFHLTLYRKFSTHHYIKSDLYTASNKNMHPKCAH